VSDYAQDSSQTIRNADANISRLEETANGIYEIPEKLEIGEAAWYYNALENRRDEVYAMYFARLKRMDEWLDVYSAAKEGTKAKELAFAKLAALEADAKTLIEIREARYDDQRIAELCDRRLAKIGGEEFAKWKEIYDLAPYGTQPRINALRRMRTLAASAKEWKEIYDRAEIGTNAQVEATQNMLLLSRFDEIKREDEGAIERKLVKNAIERTPLEWREEYERYDLYDKRSENAAINIYLSADRLPSRHSNDEAIAHL
jgi:hypothetical protein